jgi:hypothetical protein
MPLATSNTLSLEDFCNSIGVPSNDQFTESNVDYVLEAEYEATNSEEACELLWEKVDTVWFHAFDAIVKHIKEEWKIDVKHAGGIVTLEADDWDAALDVVIDSINGYGAFWYDSREELIESGPYETVRDAVILHLHWNVKRGVIYGEDGVIQVFRKELDWACRYKM